MAATSHPEVDDNVEELRQRLLLADRVDGPAILFDAWYGGEISQTTLAWVIASVWTGAEYPEQALGRKVWIELFQASGYVVDASPAESPTEPIQLWRGCRPQHRRRMSWTSDRSIAEMFAFGRLRGRATGQLYTTAAPPGALLAHINDRAEQEYLIDARGLTITREVAS